MKKLSPGFYAGIGCILVLCLAILIRSGLFASPHTPDVVLPSAVVGEDSVPFEEIGALHSDISRDTVQAVIQVLQRAEAYSFTAGVTTYWNDQSTKKTVSFWTDGDRTRIESVSDYETKNILLDGDTLSIWYADSKKVYSEALPDSTQNLSDLFFGIVTYEDILSVPIENIHSAGYVDYHGISCIKVVYDWGEFGYSYEIYVSAQDGVLVGEYTYDGDTLLRAVEFSSFSNETPDARIFDLPA